MDEVEATFAAIGDDRTRDEARRLDAIFREATGYAPRLWSGTVGYGAYDYVYDSGRSGTWFATGFRPGKRRHSIHVMPGYAAFPDIAARLGKHTRGKGCWYVNRLADVDEAVLAELIAAGVADLDAHWPVRPA